VSNDVSEKENHLPIFLLYINTLSPLLYLNNNVLCTEEERFEFLCVFKAKFMDAFCVIEHHIVVQLRIVCVVVNV
jgi:hypothetical protein